MSCCGQRRSAAAMPLAATRPAWPAPSMAHSHGTRTVVLRYRERARVLVRGPVTGQAYEFSADRPAQAVEVRDAEAMLRTARFVRA